MHLFSFIYSCAPDSCTLYCTKVHAAVVTEIESVLEMS